jgi:hypothetical protein
MSHQTEHGVLGGAAGMESGKLAPQTDAEVLKMESEDVTSKPSPSKGSSASAQ